MTVFIEDWAEGGAEQMLKDFNVGPEAIEGKTILVAGYLYEFYSGDAYVLLRDNASGAYQEVHGGHCSCYGLEGQWVLEDADPDAILRRINKGSWGVEGRLAEHVKTALGA
jgi:hypothetical protein